MLMVKVTVYIVFNASSMLTVFACESLLVINHHSVVKELVFEKFFTEFTLALLQRLFIQLFLQLFNLEFHERFLLVFLNVCLARERVSLDF